MGTSATKKESRARWPGGYVRGGVYVIEKRINGRKFHFSTHCTSLRAALKQLERFESNPGGYAAEGDAKALGALVLDEPLIEAFHEWHRHKTSRTWARNVRGLLVGWGNHFKGADLRKLSLIDDLKPYLRAHPGQPHHRVKAIRLLFKWLRQERGLVTRAEDVSLDLAIPIIKPAQQTKKKAVPFEHITRVMEHLSEEVRDLLELLAFTGMHIAEARRFASDGIVRVREITDARGVVGVLGMQHKRGRKHFYALMHVEHLTVAQRIRARGHIYGDGWLGKCMVKACAAAGISPPYKMGVLRHSVTTWLKQSGVPLEKISSYIGHASVDTTNRFYVDHEAAKTVLPRSKLRVVS